MTKFQNTTLLAFSFWLMSTVSTLHGAIKADSIKLFNIFPNFFPQVTMLNENQPDLSQFITSTSIYRQFQTLALIDILRVTDMVAGAQAVFESIQQGDNVDRCRTRIASALNENQKQLTLFIQADIKSGENTDLSTDGSSWKFWIEQDNQRYYPSAIVQEQSNPSINQIFDKKKSRFKKIYKAIFHIESDSLETARKIRQPMYFIIRNMEMEKKIPLPAETQNSPSHLCN